jgi:branched-chain amino acid transport system ATP-binding protein
LTRAVPRLTLRQGYVAALARIHREEGTAAVIVEQQARTVLAITDDAIILDRGRIVRRASSAELLKDEAALDAHLGVRDRKRSTIS